MTVEHVVVGPPGTGKTTWISRQVERAAEKYGPDRALVLSLTRAAAREAAGKTALPRAQCGTLHSICYHALGQPKMVDSAAVKAWNEEHPEWEISGAEREERDQPAAETFGDHLLTKLEIHRHRRTPVGDALAPFAAAWQDHKEQASLVDFTDMIEQALTGVPRAPGEPRVLMVDEFQDFSSLELELVRGWARHLDHFALVGDPNQSIYHWRHSAREAAELTPTIVLGQSYRVPRSVQAAAVALGRRSDTYLDAEYAPREEEGECSVLGAGWKEAETILELAERLSGTVMLIASCAYMLAPATAVMRRRGMPYRGSAAWSPLARGDARRKTAVDRLEAWLACAGALAAEGDGALPAPEQIELLARTLKRSGARPLSQEDVDWMADGATRAQMARALRAVFTEEACGAMARGDLAWLLENSLAAPRRAMEYPVAVLRRLGPAGLREEPRVIVGTIHSVKGGEADHVILAPDLSVEGAKSYRRPGWEHRDGVLRTFYVGMTRAKQSLRILRHSGWAVDLV